MNPWKELRTRWMYWRFRYITRNRQRLATRWAGRGTRPTAYESSYRGGRPAIGTGAGRTAKTWLLLLVTVVAMAIIQRYTASGDLTFLLDLAILAAGFILWSQLIA